MIRTPMTFMKCRRVALGELPQRFAAWATVSGISSIPAIVAGSQFSRAFNAAARSSNVLFLGLIHAVRYDEQILTHGHGSCALLSI